MARARRGVFVGLAFGWEARHTQTLELALARLGSLPTDAGPTRGYPALHAVGRHQEQPLIIPWSEWGGHTLLTGTTGSGKTVLLQLITQEMIAGPGPVVILDLKGEREYMAQAAAAAQRHGKPFVMIAPAFPATSQTMNVLGTATSTAELAPRIHALMPSAGGPMANPFFEQFPLGILAYIAAAQQVLGQPWTLPALWSDLSVAQHRNHLLAQCLRRLGTRGRTLKDLIAAYRGTRVRDGLVDDLLKVHEWPAKHFQEITSTFIPTFRGLVHTPLERVFSSVTPDITWRRVVDHQMVVYVSIPSMLFGDLANRMGRVILQDIVGFLGQRQAYEDCRAAVPFSIIIDELRQTLYPTMPTALAQARSAGGRIVMAQQSMADAEYVLGQAGAKVMASVINTKFWFRLTDEDDTSTTATEGLDTCDVELPDNSVGLGYGGVGGLTGNASRRLTRREVPLVRPHWFTALPTGQCFMRTRGTIYKVRVPLLTPVSDAERDALGLTALWQQLDPQTATPLAFEEDLVIEAGDGDEEDEDTEEDDV
jgi:conjugal transfer pilus assembly protein TraD